MISRTQVHTGMRVVGSDGDEVGMVKEARDTDFLVDRRMQRDVYIPYSAIQNIDNSDIVLTVSASQVDNMGWQSPPMA